MVHITQFKHCIYVSSPIHLIHLHHVAESINFGHLFYFVASPDTENP